MSTVNMEHVAQLAGVSRTTVSRVLRSPHLVQVRTRAKVESVLHEQGYVYHSAAADLSRRRSSILGLILPTVKTYAFASTILAVQEAAAEMDMTVMLGSTQYDAEKEASLLRQFQARRLSGLLLVGHTDSAERQIESIQKSGTPCVVLWTTPSSLLVSEVGFDNLQAGYMITSYLLQLGHKRIAVVSGPAEGGKRVAERVQGYRQALTEYGLPIVPEYILSGQPDIPTGEWAVQRLMQCKPRPTAIFAASDVIAIGVLSGAAAIGLSVPHDLSVAGFDNIDFSAHTNPPLTTISVPAVTMARLAVQALVDMSENKSTLIRHLLPCELVVRESCAPPKL